MESDFQRFQLDDLQESPSTEWDSGQTLKTCPDLQSGAHCTKLAAKLTNKSPGDWKMAASEPGRQLQLKLIFNFYLDFNTSNTFRFRFRFVRTYTIPTRSGVAVPMTGCQAIILSMVINPFFITPFLPTDTKEFGESVEEK